MDTFDEEDHTWLEFESLAVELSQTCHEVVLRHLDSLAGEEFENVLLKVLMVHCIEVVEVE